MREPKSNPIRDTNVSRSRIQVNQTTYDVMDNWLDVAAKHYDIDVAALRAGKDTDLAKSEISLLKTGLFGYLNEIMAQEVKSSVAHRNVLYNEHFLNSASFPESIYNFAKAYNVPISIAQPSHMQVNLAIRKTDLINSPLRKELIEKQFVRNNTLKTWEIRLSRSYEFSVGKFKFMLPYDVIITLKQTEKADYSITARYDINGDLFKFRSFTSPDIKVFQDLKHGIEYVYFTLDIYQLRSTSSNYNIVSNDVAENLFYTVKYEDQLAGFNVYYNYRGERTPLKLYFNNTTTPADPLEKYAYYTFVDNDKFQISFSNLPGGFKPAYNSSLEIEVLSTKGQEGNFNFNGEIRYSIENIDRNTFQTMIVSVYPISSASGGRNKLTIQDEKARIINKVTSRDNLITDYDLHNYFNEKNLMDNFNGSKLKFMKKRDDLLLRIYNAFLLMRDQQGKVLPTTTANRIKLPVQWFADNNNGNRNDGYVIPEHTVFRYNSSTKTYDLVETGYNDDLKREIETDKDNFIYVNPFLIRIDVDPIMNAYYYKLDINEKFDMQYTYRNSLVNSSLLINKLDISKSANFKEDLNSDTYTIRINLNSNESIQDVDKKIKIRGILQAAKTGKKYGYFEFTREFNREEALNTSDSTYISHLSTNRKFKDGNLSIADSLYDEDGNTIDDVFIDEDCVIKIGVLYYDPKNEMRTNEVANAENAMFLDAFPADQQKSLNIRDYTLATTTTTISSVRLYRNLSNVMTSTVYRDDSNPALDMMSRDFYIEAIPLLGIDYFIHEHKYAYTVLDAYIEILNDAIHRLENSTRIDLKFYNTRGPSKYYYVSTDVRGDKTEAISLARTDILIDFTIHTFVQVNDEFDESIKDFISDYIEASNDEGVIPISNLIRLLESNFEEIRYIEFNGISSRHQDALTNRHQKILAKSTDLKLMSKQEVIDFVPEYINVKKQLLNHVLTVEDSVTGEAREVPIGTKYSNVINITYEYL